MNWKGKVSKASKRDWGTKTIYSWQIEGCREWFRSERDLNVQEGDLISFDGESAQKITEVFNTTEEEVVSEVVSQQVISEQLKATSEAPPTNSPDYWRWKQMRDLENENNFKWRDARADATRIVCAALDNGVLALGNTQGKKLGLVKAYVKEITAELVEDLNER